MSDNNLDKGIAIQVLDGSIGIFDLENARGMLKSCLTTIFPDTHISSKEVKRTVKLAASFREPGQVPMIRIVQGKMLIGTMPRKWFEESATQHEPTPEVVAETTGEVLKDLLTIRNQQSN